MNKTNEITKRLAIKSERKPSILGDIKIEDWGKSRPVLGDEYNSLTGFGLASKAVDTAKNAEFGVQLLIREVLRLRDQVEQLSKGK